MILTQSALICFKCDIHAVSSDLIYVGIGTNISGLVYISKNFIVLENCSVQSRLSGKMIGGLVMQTNQLNIVFQDTNITNYLNGNEIIGALISFATNNIQISSSNLQICSNAVQNVGFGESYVVISGILIQNCLICRNIKYSYGICQSSLEFSEQINYKLVCKQQFYFDGEKCSCIFGKVINSSCINILAETDHLLSQFEVFAKNLRQQELLLLDNISVFKQNAIIQIQQVNISNPSINENFNIQQGISTDIYLKYLTLYDAIQLVILKFKCGRQYGHAFVNNQCQNIICTISGQYAINGVCQCPSLNMIINGDTCVCPENSQLINNACTCTISGQVVQSGICQCKQLDAFVSGNACVCPINSSIIGNKCICSVIGQIIINGVCLCSTTGAFILNGACSCGTDSLNISNICSCPTYSQLNGNACICSGIIGISMINGSCICHLGYTIVNGICQYTIDTGDTEIICSQFTYITSFEILTTTHQVISNANYSSGYVFKTTTIIQNAFIDISNNVYTSTIQPLFQSQASFTNIKVQIGFQTVNTGSIITSATTITITQTNIVSKINTQITVNTLQQLQIIQNYTTTAQITNLLVNLSFTHSSGNITLINISSGVMNITGYQLLGVYQSTQYIAMIAFTIISQSTLKIYNLTFQPSIYCIGNLSSYYFINVDTSSVIFNNISVILGTMSQFQTLTSISSTDSNKYQFGGLIAIIGVNSNIIVINLLFDCYQIINTNYTINSGFIFSSIQSNQISKFQNLCILQYFKSSSLIFKETSLMGSFKGALSINQCSIMFTTQCNSDDVGAAFGSFGVIASQSGQSEVTNLLVTMNLLVNTVKFGRIGFFGSGSGGPSVIQHSIFKNFNMTLSFVGILCGFQRLEVSSIINTTVKSCNISATNAMSGFFADAWNNNIYVLNSSVKNMNMTALESQYSEQNYVGAMFGCIMSDNKQNLCITNSSVVNNNMFGKNTTGGVVGQLLYFGMMDNQPFNVTIVDLILTNNNISGKVFTSGVIADYSKGYKSQVLFLQNLTLLECNITCTTGSCGGLVGTFGETNTQSASLIIKNTTLQNIKITGPSFVAGIAGVLQKCLSFTSLQIYNSMVSSVVLTGQSCGMIVGFSNGTSTFDIQTSKTTGNNFVNSTLIQNCVSITNGISQSGC
ncbi:Conserved_hypothetical protein [Hexamita inflata]|uniref:Uncharacterized protein n=1 Tax=Hexamita inflata TaxID=28002 RepID=A0AA86U2U2_9EUKA|nr:Conserved hypothetical protein [Hexamita inflata]CAI9937736.1 Conserved hypothetical protein [Hexamita inflata]